MNVETIKGLNVIIVQNHEEGEQIRKHHKRRINKKWLKRYGVYGKQKLKKSEVYKVCENVYMSRLTYKQLKEQLKEQNK